MPRLIVLNGAPASGKSTLARRWVDDNPLALDLDIDVIRRQLGDWKSDPHAAGLLARAVALAAARTHLAGGHDVIVPQYLGRPDFLVQLTGLATETGAALHEFILMDTKDVMVARFRARTAAAADRSHLDAQEMLDRVGGVPQLEAMYDRLLLIIAARPGAQLLPAREGEIEATYAELVRRIG